MATLAIAARPAPASHQRSGTGFWVVTSRLDRDHGWIASVTPPDPHELRRLSEDQLLALVVAHRTSEDAGSKETARLAWNELVERDIDRVASLVRTWKLPGKDVRVAQQDRDDAAQHAFYRLLKMLSNFRGEVVPQYRAAMGTCVDWACREFCRSEMRHEMGLGGSLDERLNGDEGEIGGRFDPVVADISEQVEQERENGRAALDAVTRAIAGLPNENMKAVLRLTMEGYQSKEIAQRLDLQVANVDQLRSRALRRLTPELKDHVDL